MATIDPFEMTYNFLQVSDGNTVPSVNINGKQIYPNIGSGTVCKLFWDTPAAVGNTVESYQLKITCTYQNGALSLNNLNVGHVNEFYITSDWLGASSVTKLNVTLEANSIHGAAYNGTIGTATINITDSAGMYIKVEDGYTQSIMKRAVALARISDTSDSVGLLQSSDGYELLTLDNLLLAEDVLIWAIMKDFYTKDSQGSWKPSDIMYEVLTDMNGDPITTDTNEFIYLK